MVVNLAKAYKDRLPTLRGAAERLEEDLRLVLAGQVHLDSIRARAKSIDRFLEKWERKKYKMPLEEIQDQVGVRVVVYYLSDVDIIRKVLLKHFAVIEDSKHAPEDPTVFDYEAWHMMCAIPADLQKDCPVPFFELQIATLFQHAWAETHHDLGYTPQQELPFERKRRLAHAAAQAWGADHTMQELLSAPKDNK